MQDQEVVGTLLIAILVRDKAVWIRSYETSGERFVEVLFFRALLRVRGELHLQSRTDSAVELDEHRRAHTRRAHTEQQQPTR